MNPDVFDFAILGPAFVAGLLVLSTHVPLGQRVLARGIIFIDLAIAQVAALGVIAAHGLSEEIGPYAIQAVAIGGALGAALLLSYTERRWPDIQEALIGSLFVLAASVGLLLLAGNPHGGERLKELLVGQILWVSWPALETTAIVYAILLALWWLRRGEPESWLFYVTFAVAVTASVQLVGVYLVFASLILPALAVRGLETGRALTFGYGVGILGYGTGIVLSAVLDRPTGAVIVCTLAAASAGAAVLRSALGPAAGR
jgi:zinc/manganese transport system permease protein